MDDVREGGGWGRVAPYVRAEIDRHFEGSPRAAERATGVAFVTIKKLLDGKPVNRRPPLVRLASAFGWTPDSFDRIRAGGEPELSDGPTTDEPPGLDERVSRLEVELRRQGEQLREIRDALGGAER